MTMVASVAETAIVSELPKSSQQRPFFNEDAVCTVDVTNASLKRHNEYDVNGDLNEGSSYERSETSGSSADDLVAVAAACELNPPVSSSEGLKPKPVQEDDSVSSTENISGDFSEKTAAKNAKSAPAVPQVASPSTTGVRPEAEKRRVQFGTITINEHPVCAGDNPGGIEGPPLTIAWEAVERATISIDDYENSRPPRRGQSQMAIPKPVRETMLKNQGFSRAEIMACTRSANILRAKRQHTRATSSTGIQPFEEAMEKMTRLAVHAVTFGARKRKEKELMKHSAISTDLIRSSSSKFLTASGKH